MQGGGYARDIYMNKENIEKMNFQERRKRMRKIISIILMGVILLSSITVIAYENEKNEEFEKILSELSNYNGKVVLAHSGTTQHLLYPDGTEEIIEYKVTDEDKQAIISLLETVIDNGYLHEASSKNIQNFLNRLGEIKLYLTMMNRNENGGYEEVIAKIEEVEKIIPSKEEKSDTKVIVGGKTKTHATFTDVKKSDWFYDDVDKAYNAGLITGVEPTLFKPYGTLTTAEALTLASRINVIEDDGTGNIKVDGLYERLYELDSFVLDNTWHWAEGYMNYAIEHNIIQKNYTLEELDTSITRAEMADLFSRALHISSEEHLNDFTKASEQNISDSVKQLYELGIMVGDDNGSFRLNDYITRAETSAIVCRMLFPERRISK